MIYTIVLVAASLGLVFSLYMAGRANAFMDAIGWNNSVRKRLGEWYSRELAVSNKDRNHDGKISFMENAAPDDGWHYYKREMTSFFKLAMANSVVIGIALNGFSSMFIFIYLCCYVVVVFSVFGIVFSYYYDKMKKW
jgi:hypothetical protein